MTRDRFATVFDLAEMRLRARRRLPRMVFDFIDGGADDERTLRENGAALARLTFAPRAMTNVRKVSTSLELFGVPLSMPLLLSPTGLPGLAHPKAELAAARAAREAGILFTASTVSSYSLQEIASTVAGPHWFQLYAWNDKALTGKLVDKAREAGYRMILLTIDTPVVGNRERDLRNGMVLPPRVTFANVTDMLRRWSWIWGQIRGPGVKIPNIADLETQVHKGGTGPAGYLKGLFNPEQSWDYIGWIKERFGGPVGVKGIITATDARRARDAGADTIVVSNHGGRQLDGAPATITVLPEIVEALRGSGMPILIDSGIRRGSDIVRALALGATACMIGRPWLWGLAAGGTDGVRRVIELLRTELERTMALVGATNLRELSPELIRQP
ncbi:alpha-hydroxy-acid oxidizing protein [bacterium]|nr:MAG: alpha-hydroxy-acid oxidizing protein [bacterium]